jgi:cellulose synthase/poly-beta-1,6-N-acetylglucosamine synthase-like glycosyltransferase
MVYLYWSAGIVLALAWFSRIVQAALGVPKIADISKEPWDRHPNDIPRVSIIVPARNEEEDIEECLRGMLALDYDNYEVVAVDDRSTDRTGEIVEGVAAAREAHGRLKVIRVAELPSGWLGKAHAMWTAASQATGDWLLFTDADVLFKPDVLRRALAYAEAEKADHVVVFPRMIMKHPGERMMIAFFQTLFTFGHRPWKVADPDSKDHMGVGAFNMVRRSVYDAVGTYRALRMEVLDDMKLGKVIKNARFRQRNVFGEDLISIHWAQGAMGVVHNLTKNFFAVLCFQWWRGIASVFGLLFLNLGPFVGVWLTHGWERVPYTVALSSIFLIYLGMSFKSSIPPYYFFLHPISTLLFGYTLVRSMFLTLWNDGVTWRGTTYPLDELRKGLV